MFSWYPYNDGGHFDTRPDVRNCILCHNDQQRIGSGTTFGAEVTSVNGVFPPLTPAQIANRRLAPRIGDGEVMFDMPIMIHKFHMGDRLTKTAYNFDGVKFNEAVYTQDVTNCRKCHSADTPAELAATPQGNNWKDKPSRLACGSCHDGINWTTGAGHVGGPAANDSLCYVCHTPVAIDTINHVTPNATPNNPSVPAGATNFTYEISSVTVNASNQPVVKFRIMAVTPPATTATAVKFVKSTGTGGVNPLTGFTGAPSFLVAYAKAQDGIASPADFNNLGNGVLGAQPVSVSIAKLCDTSVDASGTVGTQGSMTGPDADGYYTATLNGPIHDHQGDGLWVYYGYCRDGNGNSARHCQGNGKDIRGNDGFTRNAGESGEIPRRRHTAHRCPPGLFYPGDPGGGPPRHDGHEIRHRREPALGRGQRQVRPVPRIF